MSNQDPNRETEYDLTGIPASQEKFSLEEILAEYGGSLEQTLLRQAEEVIRAEEAAKAPEPPETPAGAPASPERASGGPEKEASAQAAPPEAEKTAQAQSDPETAPAGDTPPEPDSRDSEPPEAATYEAGVLTDPDEPSEPEKGPSLPVPEPTELPHPPNPISLEEVVGSTVSAVMDEEERAEPLLQPRRKLFSRRPLEDTERIPPPPEPEPEEEIEPIGPEAEPWEASEEYRRLWRVRKGSVAPALLTAVLSALPLVLERYGVTIPMWTGDTRFQSILYLAMLAIQIILCRHVFIKALEMLSIRRCVGELLISLASLAALGDCVISLTSGDRTPVTPYAAAVCAALFFGQMSVAREMRGMYDTFRAAAMADPPPYLVTDTPRGACKQQGSVPGFYTAAMRPDVSALWQTILLPLILAGSVVFAGLTSLGQGRKADFLLNLSITLIAGGTCALPLCWALPWSCLARHLQKVGCAVAGWSGAEKISRRRCMILTDTDLFPPGTVQLNGIKLYGEERVKAYGYAAAMARRAGSGLERLFDRLYRGEGGTVRESAEDFSFYEEGGWSAAIHGESVLMGTASFLRKMEVRLPGDINLKTGLFLAVDHHLIAVFAVKYHPAENVDYALRMMRRGRVTPILASRDPNIDPALLKRKFHKGVRVEYPILTERIALSEAGQDRDLPRALLFREGLMPYAETVVGSRRLCKGVRRSTAISLAGSIAGLLLGFYLLTKGAYDLLNPLSLLVFLLLWTLPVLLISDWARRY